MECEGIAGQRESPLLSRGGVDARSKKCSEATEIRADGVVLIKFNQILLTNTTPSAPTRWLRTFFFMSRPPLLS